MSITADTLVIGQHVHCVLYGGKDGFIEAIHGEQKPETVRTIMGGLGAMGGKADFDIIWNDGTRSHRVSESLIRSSVQWRISTEVASAEVLANAQAYAVLYQAQQKVKAEEQNEAFRLSKEKAIADYPYLTRLEKGEYGGKFAAKNMRIELKRAWPKVKFSVKSDYNSVHVSWTDGPTSGQVDDLIGKYQDGYFDGMEDLSVSTPSGFTEIFSGARYVNTSREHSDDLMDLSIAALWARLPENLEGIDKPKAATMRSSRTEEIPCLEGLTIGEAARFIASAWDTTSSRYVPNKRYSRATWLVFEIEGEPRCQPLVAPSSN